MNRYKELSKQAQKLRSKLKMCVSKKSYETKQLAYQKGQRVYQCPHCGKWHRSGQFARFVKQLQSRRSTQNLVYR